MTITGSCLCGAFRFQIEKAAGPFEICHCNRCRKRSGSAGLAMIGVMSDRYQVLSGADNVEAYSAPILKTPPPYHSYFCRTCGSPVPRPDPTGWFEIPAGLFDDDPELRPDKHIFTELAADWDSMEDSLPKFTLRELIRARRGEELPDDHELVTHYGDRLKI